MDRREILERVRQTIYECVPELQGVELRENMGVNAGMGIDSMSFLLIICKLEEEFGARIPNREWRSLSTLGEVADAIIKYMRE